MSKKKEIFISVVVPLFNEEEGVPLLYSSIKEVCEEMDQRYEILFVDDGSTDSTFAELEKIQKADPSVRVVKFRKNYGQTAAMASGFENARGRIIVSMDGDLQNDPKDIKNLLAKLDEGYDVVCGWRKNRQDKFWSRRVPSMVANWIIGRITGVRIHDNGCSLKAYRHSAIKNVKLYNEMHRFIPAMSTLAGARIAEIVVNHHPRRFGASKYGIGRTWRVILDIFTIKMITGFVSRPALWFGLFGLPVLILGFVIFFFGGWFYMRDFIEEWIVLSTTAFLFLFLGIHFLATGILAELCLKTGDYLPQEGVASSITIQ